MVELSRENITFIVDCFNCFSCLFSLGWFTWIRTAGPGPVFAGHKNISYWLIHWVVGFFLFFWCVFILLLFLWFFLFLFFFSSCFCVCCGGCFFCLFLFFLFRVPAWDPKVNASAFESRWLPVDMPSADAHVEYVLSSKHLGCYIKKCSAFQNPSDEV